MFSKLMILEVCIAAVIPTANAALADTDSRYFTIGKIETHEVISTDAQATAPSALTTPSSDLMSQHLAIGGVDIGTIINIGKEVWDIIEANKPVSNVTTNTASAIPQGVTNWETLAGWQAPQVKTFETTFTNALGLDVITFQYGVSYTAGGTYQDQGQYLTNVAVTPSNLHVAWGYTFNAQVTIPSITNAGTTKSPIGAATVLVQWSIDTVVTHVQQSAEYYVRGDGQFSTIQ